MRANRRVGPRCLLVCFIQALGGSRFDQLAHMDADIVEKRVLGIGTELVDGGLKLLSLLLLGLRQEWLESLVNKLREQGLDILRALGRLRLTRERRARIDPLRAEDMF